MPRLVVCDRLKKGWWHLSDSLDSGFLFALNLLEDPGVASLLKKVSVSF